MIEHVRRRALLVDNIDDVFVATCDQQIAEVVTGYGGKVIMTGNHHKNGTTRVAEAVADIDCSHVILLQGDEPLLLPGYVSAMVEAIKKDPDGDSWNGTAPLSHAAECDRHSFVKCAIGTNQQIMCCFRRSPAYCDFESQRNFVHKILGIIAYRKDFLAQLVKMEATPFETSEFIEQMRILENGFQLTAVSFDQALPSVNEPGEADAVIAFLQNDEEQRKLLIKTRDTTATKQ
jgi:3-deoxy-manno-octulosonate cytidylyltransferase (CMP-KDO synthetase)